MGWVALQINKFVNILTSDFLLSKDKSNINRIFFKSTLVPDHDFVTQTGRYRATSAARMGVGDGIDHIFRFFFQFWRLPQEEILGFKS